MQHKFNLCATKVGNIKQISTELDFIYTLLSRQKYLSIPTCKCTLYLRFKYINFRANFN